MKRVLFAVVAGAICGCLFAVVAISMTSPQPAHAQNPTLTPYQFAVSAPHTNCVVSTGQTNYCFASDGPYVSINGAAYVSMLSGSSSNLTGQDPISVSGGVISLNSDAALHTIIANLGLKASVPISSVAVPAVSGTLPATTAPVQ